MNLLNRKMLIAPLLAIVLALLLAGSVSYLPQDASQAEPTPHPTSYSGTPPPVQQSSAAVGGNFLPVLFGVAAILVGVVAAFLLFSEKKLNKEISS
jgi:starvation-inducible outer membrane lipoprotein